MPRESRPSGSGPTLRDLMTTEVLTLSPDDSLRRAVEVLSTHKISGAPVVAGEQVVGVLSVTDIIAFQRDRPPQSRRSGRIRSSGESGNPRMTG